MGSNISIQDEGGISIHVDAFFTKRGSDKTFDDVLRLKNLKVGNRGLPIQQQADELGVSRAVLYKWYDIIDRNG